MTASDWMIASATIAGPILAVQAQKWIERARESRGRKNWVFQTLMMTRNATVSADHVRALNAIDLSFYGKRILGKPLRSAKDQAVIDAWREYFDHLNSGPGEGAAEAVKVNWMARRSELFTNLLQMMATALNYNFDRVQLQKGIYSPIAHGELEGDIQAYRKFGLELIRGERALKVEVGLPAAGNAPPSAPPPPAPAAPRTPV
jgi:hypothetical protein